MYEFEPVGEVAAPRALRREDSFVLTCAACGCRLTARESEVVQLVARGMSNKAIARVLDISHDTVKLHVKHILAKLNLTSRVEAAVFAVEQKAAGQGRHSSS